MCFAYKQKDVAKFMDPALVPEMLGGAASDEECLIPIQDAQEDIIIIRKEATQKKITIIYEMFRRN